MADTGNHGDTVVLEEVERGTVVEWKMRLYQEAKASHGDTLVNKVSFQPDN